MLEKKKIAYIENIKILAIILIIGVHIGKIFSYNFLNIGGLLGGGGNQLNISSLLFGFVLYIGYAFLMCPFFFFGAYFGQKSLEKKGIRPFLLERIKRLIVPFFLFLPVAAFLHYDMNFGPNTPYPDWSYFASFFLNRGFWGIIGKPIYLWFLPFFFLLSVAHIFALSFFRKSPRWIREITPKKLFFGTILSITILSFLLKISFDPWPIVREYRLEYAGIYIFSYVLGIFAQKSGFLEKLTVREGWLFGAFGLIAALLSLAIFFPGVGALTERSIHGITFGNGIFSFLQAVVAIGFSVGVFVLFREKGNIDTPVLRFLSRQTFAVYLIHFPLIVLVKYTHMYVPFTGGGRFVFYFGVFTIVSYALAFLATSIPGLRKIL